MALGGLQESADVLARSLSSEETAAAIKKAAPEAEYEVVPDLSTSAPILAVTATSPLADRADKMMAAVLQQIPESLGSLQQNLGIQRSNMITTMVLSSDKKPALIQKTRVRILGALGAALILGSAIVVAAIDGFMVRRAERRRRSSEEVEGAVSAPTQAQPEGEGTRSPGRKPKGRQPIEREQVRRRQPPAERRPADRAGQRKAPADRKVPASRNAPAARGAARRGG
jgi:hypothetical protein